MCGSHKPSAYVPGSIQFARPAYVCCARCKCRVRDDEPITIVEVLSKGKPGVRYAHQHCDDRSVYEYIADAARDIIIAVLEEGEAKYPDVTYRAIVDKPDNIEHALAHLEAWQAGDRSEDHREHAMVRCLLEVLRKREEYGKM